MAFYMNLYLFGSTKEQLWGSKVFSEELPRAGEKYTFEFISFTVLQISRALPRVGNFMPTVSISNENDHSVIELTDKSFAKVGEQLASCGYELKWTIEHATPKAKRGNGTKAKSRKK